MQETTGRLYSSFGNCDSGDSFRDISLTNTSYCTVEPRRKPEIKQRYYPSSTKNEYSEGSDSWGAFTGVFICILFFFLLIFVFSYPMSYYYQDNDRNRNGIADHRESVFYHSHGFWS